MSPRSSRPGAASVAGEIVAGTSAQDLGYYARALEDESKSVSTHAARVVEEVVSLKPALATAHIERLVRLLGSKQERVVQACAHALPDLARAAPAKVAKHLPRLRDSYAEVDQVAQDGIVRTFVALCTASVAYQKRLIDVIERALQDAEPKLLLQWSQIVLPVLKGEPHAQARAVVEQRLPNIPRAEAQKIADFLGVKLRPVPR